jgi:hypothetical protein
VIEPGGKSDIVLTQMEKLKIDDDGVGLAVDGAVGNDRAVVVVVGWID